MHVYTSTLSVDVQVLHLHLKRTPLSFALSDYNLIPTASICLG